MALLGSICTIFVWQKLGCVRKFSARTNLNAMSSIHFSASRNDQLLFAQLRRKVDKLINQEDHRFLFLIKVKALSLVAAYFILYFISLFFVTNHLIHILCYVMMGVVVVPIFLTVVHEAVHNNLFQTKGLNRYILYIFDILGANSFIWERRHKLLHHSFQNIAGWDSDIEQSNMMRIYPHDRRKKFQRFQHLYMWVLYPLYLVNWVFVRDFKDYFSKKQIINKVCHIPRREYLKLILFKAFFLCYMVVIPVLTGKQIGTTILSMFAMIVTAGIFALIILLTPHANVRSSFPRPDNSGRIQDSWLQHQFATTNDVYLDNWFSRNLLANFNLHLAHHLFPWISHLHAPKVTGLIIDFCKDNGFEYRSYSLWIALKYHYDLVKQNALVDAIFEEDM